MVNELELAAPPAGAVTLIRPDVAPAGTVAVITGAMMSLITVTCVMSEVPSADVPAALDSVRVSLPLCVVAGARRDRLAFMLVTPSPKVSSVDAVAGEAANW